jgi:hypothetical protein
LIELMSIFVSIFSMDFYTRFKYDQEFVLATHVFANVAHFRKLLAEYPWDSQSDWVHWALLEATLIKARAITDFLITKKQRHPDDFCAESLLDSWIQQEIDFLEIRDLVNKQVAHFSLQRYIQGNPDAVVSAKDLIEILNLVDEAFYKFQIELERQRPELFKDLGKQFVVFSQ